MLKENAEALAALARQTQDQVQQTQQLLEKASRLIQTWRQGVVQTRQEYVRHKKWVTGQTQAGTPSERVQ